MGEIIGSGVLHLNTMPRLPEVGEDSSAVQFNHDGVDANSVSCLEEYETQVDSAQGFT